MNYILIKFIRLYQITISPLLLPTCRYYPTCSQYAIQSLLYFGVCQGGWLAIKRLLRCHPFGSYGYDPIVGKNGENNAS